MTLPLVSSAGDIDAEIVKGSVFELAVEGLYAMQATLPTQIDEVPRCSGAHVCTGPYVQAVMYRA